MPAVCRSYTISEGVVGGGSCAYVLAAPIANARALTSATDWIRGKSVSAMFNSSISRSASTARPVRLFSTRLLGKVSPIKSRYGASVLQGRGRQNPIIGSDHLTGRLQRNPRSQLSGTPWDVSAEPCARVPVPPGLLQGGRLEVGGADAGTTSWASGPPAKIVTDANAARMPLLTAPRMPVRESLNHPVPWLFARGHRLPHPDRGHGSSHHCGNLAHLLHQFIELIGEERLRSVGERFIRFVVNFDHQTVGTDGYRRAREWCDFVALAGAVAGIDQNGQMTEPLHRGYQAQIERVAGMVGEGPHATLAQRHVVVAFAQNIFGRHQEFFQRGRHAALQQYGLAGASGAFEQRKILHVARADLNHVGILLHQVERLVVDSFGDDLHAKLLADFCHDPQAFLFQALKRVRRSAGLVRAPAKELRSGTGDALGDRKRLVVILDGARPRNNRQSRAADGGISAGETDDRVVLLDIAADQLVGL